MRQLTNITGEPIQNFVLIIGNEQADIQLRFSPVTQIWCFTLTFRGITISNVKLSLGVFHINSYNFPFDFWLQDTSNEGIDPFKVNDFVIGRINMFMFTPEEMAAFRGYNVKVL